jgi:hypothetical protein
LRRVNKMQALYIFVLERAVLCVSFGCMPIRNSAERPMAIFCKLLRINVDTYGQCSASCQPCRILFYLTTVPVFRGLG